MKLSRFFGLKLVQGMGVYFLSALLFFNTEGFAGDETEVNHAGSEPQSPASPQITPEMEAMINQILKEAATRLRAAQKDNYYKSYQPLVLRTWCPEIYGPGYTGETPILRSSGQLRPAKKGAAPREGAKFGIKEQIAANTEKCTEHRLDAEQLLFAYWSITDLEGYKFMNGLEMFAENPDGFIHDEKNPNYEIEIAIQNIFDSEKILGEAGFRAGVKDRFGELSPEKQNPIQRIQNLAEEYKVLETAAASNTE